MPYHNGMLDYSEVLKYFLLLLCDLSLILGVFGLVRL